MDHCDWKGLYKSSCLQSLKLSFIECFDVGLAVTWDVNVPDLETASLSKRFNDKQRLQRLRFHQEKHTVRSLVNCKNSVIYFAFTSNLLRKSRDVFPGTSCTRSAIPG